MKIFVGGNPNGVCCVTEKGIVSSSPIKDGNTNNVAEYRAVLFGLFKHPEATEVCSDSQLVIRQLNGEYAVKSRELLPYWLRVKARVEKLGHEVKFTSISKEDNTARGILG